MQIQKKGAQKVVRKAFVLIVSVCVLLFTACGQKPVNSEEVSSPQEPSVERKNSILTEGGDDLPAAGTEVTAQTAPENATEETAATSSGKATSADAASQRTSKQAPVAPTPTEDIPSETVHAKTGYVEPEPSPEPDPTPEPTAPADRQAAIDVANAYAVTQYGVVTDSGLTLDNSAYRFPAAVPVDASQATPEVKARDMVDFTFKQLMMQAGRDSVADAGFHCNVCIVEDGGSLLIYVLYD